jgi:hypothetical protein
MWPPEQRPAHRPCASQSALSAVSGSSIAARRAGR